MQHVTLFCFAGTSISEPALGHRDVSNAGYHVDSIQGIKCGLAEVRRYNREQLSMHRLPAKHMQLTEMPFSCNTPRTILWERHVYTVGLLDETVCLRPWA